MKKIIKQILIILVLSILVGLLVNAVNPKGIPLVMDPKRYSTEESDKIKEDFVNNPYDTSNHKEAFIQNPHYNKAGFVEPQNIKKDLAKLFYDKKALFIDARKAEEFNAGHIKGSLNYFYEDFHKKSKEEQMEMLKGLNKNGIIVCYCNGGECDMSIDLAYDIAKLGFKSVNIYLGGYKEWEDAGYPVEK